MRALLDVNVLIALMATGHIHHTMAIDWMENNLSVDWASCPITQMVAFASCLKQAIQGALRLPKLPRGWQKLAAFVISWHTNILKMWILCGKVYSEL
jgi:predicted nucleic acid-binding protein